MAICPAASAAGRGKARQVGFPLVTKPDFWKMCTSSIDLCPMTILPCNGQMNPGEEGLCGKCESQLSMAENAPESCVQCELGKGFFCTRAGT